MTVSSKLFLAALLIAGGFGIATLIGKPAVRLNPAPFSGFMSARKAPTPTAKQADGALAGSPAGRLVPDFGAANPYAMQTSAANGSNAPGLLLGAAEASAADLQTNVSADVTAYSSDAPRAKLKNEAPRPLAIDNRTRAPIQQLPPAATAWPPRAAASQNLTGERQTAAMIPADFSQGVNGAAAIVASFADSSGTANGGMLVSPPPWPAEDESSQTHIIVDGDSLAKLAGRYLDDPRRAHEIFQLNRELLTSPDLLPIGAELKLPTRARKSSVEDSGWQSSAFRPAEIRAATQGSVPVNPIPSSSGVMPRAQLIRPLPIE